MINIPTIFVIFGATGDLVSKKIVPSLYQLFQKNQLPDKFIIIGVSSDKKSDEEFRETVYASLVKHPDIQVQTCGEFCQIFQYQEGDFGKAKTYKDIGALIDKIESAWGVCTNKLFCLAIPPYTYTSVIEHLSASGLTQPCGGIDGWSRVLIEKPFGNDLKSAKELGKTTRKLLKEEQVYHIDHYLGKEMIRNILAFRFANDLFAGQWNRDHISEINIKLFETEGVEARGKFYDSVGTLRDVGQNHLLEMLALLCMDHPGKHTSELIRAARLEVIKGLTLPNEKEIKENTYRSQYKGYLDIEGVGKNSKKETFFSIKTVLNTPLWEGVSVTMEAGKRLGSKRKEIEVIFKHTKDCLCKETDEPRNPSRIVFALEPEEDIGVYFLAKKPGLEDLVEPQEMHFNMRDVHLSEKYVAEYEKLILDAIAGDQTLFVSADEIEASWRFIDSIEKVWDKNIPELSTYEASTDEPANFAKEKFQSKIATSEQPKEITIIGLGKMGGNIARNLIKHDWKVNGYDTYKENSDRLLKEGVNIISSLSDIVTSDKKQKIIWLMVPAGDVINKIIFGKNGLIEVLKKGDVIIDGGNSYYEDSVKRYKKLKELGIHYIDAGVSGGPFGALNGATLMVGGDSKIISKLDNLFLDLSVVNGYSYLGSSGAGHFAKMIHNGIEYGMMQSLAEGFDILNKSEYKYDLSSLSNLYSNGSVISSRLTEWLSSAYKNDGNELTKITGEVDHTGEAEWTSLVAKKAGIKIPVIDASIKARKLTKGNPTYQGKVLSAMREKFGGHSVRKMKDKNR